MSYFFLMRRFQAVFRRHNNHNNNLRRRIPINEHVYTPFSALQCEIILGAVTEYSRKPERIDPCSHGIDYRVF